MSSHEDDEDIDIEALFEAELAKVTAYDDPISLDGDDFEGASSSEELDLQEEALAEKEDAPLQRLRAAFARRDVALEELERTLQHTREEVIGPGDPAPRDAPSDGLTSRPEDVAVPSSTGVPLAPNDTPSGQESRADGQGTSVSPNAAPTVVEGSTVTAQSSCQDAGRMEQAHQPLADTRRYQDELECLAVITETEAQLAAASAEQERRAKEREEIAARLEQAARSAAERAAAREAVAEALRQETLAMARRHIAVLRIARAWLRFRARGARDRATVRIQAAWRGCMGRRVAARVRRERDTMQEVSARLQSAALKGDVMEYKAAVAAAQSHPHLAGLVAESNQAFLARRRAVEGKLRTAVAGRPIAEVSKLLKEAVAVGLEGGLLTEVREAARRRDAQVAMELSATGQGCSNTAPFEMLAERAQRLGLKGDVAATRLALDRRRRILTVELHKRSGTASAAAMVAMIREARRIGMVAEAAELERHLRQRQQHLQTALEHAASHASATCFARMLLGASHMGLPPSLLLASQDALRQRQSACSQALTTTTTRTTLRSALLARGAAASCGARLLDLLAADQALHCRRLAAAADLERVLRSLCAAIMTPEGWHAITHRALLPGLQLGQPRMVLARAVDQRTTARGSNEEERGQQAPGDEGASGGSKVGAHNAAPSDFPDSLDPSVPPAIIANLNDSQILGWRTAGVSSERTAVHGGVGSSSSSSSTPASQSRVVASISSQTKGTSKPFGWLREACAMLWSSLVLTMQLGLSGMAVLALCVFELNQQVQLADGQHLVGSSILEHDYWGEPLRPAGRREAHAYAQSGEVVMSSALDVAVDSFRELPRHGGAGGDGVLLDSLAMRLLQCWQTLGGGGAADVRLRQLGAVDPWVQLASIPWCSPLTNTSDTLSASTTATKANSKTQQLGSSSSSKATASQQPHLRQRPKHTDANAVNSALRAVVMQNAPAGTSSLTAIVSLDLGLERLSSLVGLDVLCPGLRCLSADANELTQLRGLASLTRLQELSLKHNLMTALQTGPHGAQEGEGLPPGRALRRLVLDSNRLDGVLSGLHGCSNLRTVSLADNTLTDVGDTFHASASALTSLMLRNNRLTALPSATTSLTRLRELDVSCNQLSSLGGIQSLILLRSFDGHGNAIQDLPRPLYLPFLTSLDLTQNALSEFVLSDSTRPPIVLPSLARLLLGSNQLSSIGPLGSLMHLYVLNIASNQLKLADIMRALAGLSGLQQLHMDDNPGTSAPGLNTSVAPHGPQQPLGPMALLPGLRLLAPYLRELDHEEVTPSDKGPTGATCHFAAASLLAASAVSRSIRAKDTYAAVRCRFPLSEAAQTSHSMSQMSAVGFLKHRRVCGRVGGQQQPAAGNRGLPTVLTQQPSFPYHALVLASPLPDQWLPASSVLRTGPGLHSLLSPGCDVGASSAPARHVDAPLRPQHIARGSVASSKHIRGPNPAASWLLRQEARWRMAAVAGIAERHHHRQEAPHWPFDSPRNSPQRASVRATQTLNMAARRLPSLSIDPGDTAWDGRLRVPLRALSWLADVTHGGGTGAAKPIAAAMESVTNKLEGPALEVLATEVNKLQEQMDMVEQRTPLHEVQQRLQQLGCGGGSGQAPIVQSPSLAVNPSYLLYRMACEAHCVAARLQSVRHWLGGKSCRAAMGLRQGHSQARQHAAARTIQSWWRGYSARRRMRLAAQEADMDRQRAPMAEQDRLVREAAAVKIQSYFRGHMVRKKLRTALAAARLPARSDTDLDNDDLLLASDELDNMLNGLRPVESLLAESGLQIPLSGTPNRPLPLSSATQYPSGSEDSRVGSRAGVIPPLRLAPSWSAAAAEAAGDSVWAGADSRKLAPLQTQLSVPGSPMLSGNNLPGRLAALQGVGSLQGAALNNNMDRNLSPQQQLQQLQQQQLVNAAIQPSLSVPAGGYPGLLMAGFKSPTHLQIPAASDHQQAALGAISTPSQQGTPLGGSDTVDRGSSSNTSVGQHGDGPDPRERRDRRYRERLTALMAEWGFSNMATAEAYLRRTTRHKPRKEPEVRHRNPTDRPPNFARPAAGGPPAFPTRLQPLPHPEAGASVAPPHPPPHPPGRNSMPTMTDSDRPLPSTRPQRDPLNAAAVLKAHSSAGSSSSVVPPDGFPQLSNRSASIRSQPASEPSEMMKPRYMPRSADGRIIGQNSAPASPDVALARRPWLTPPEPLPSQAAGRKPIPCVLPTLTNNWVASPQQQQPPANSKGSYLRPAVQPLTFS